MRRFILLALLVSLISFAQTSTVFAADVFNNVCDTGNTSALCNEAGKNQTYADNGLFGVNGILNKTTNFLLIIIGIVGVIMIMVGGIQYSLSGGDPQKINKAKDMIIYTLVGLIVALIAKSIITFVINRVA